MEVFSAMVAARQPLLPGCFAFVDGLCLPMQQPPSAEKQNAYYNSWKSAKTGVCVSNVLCFTPDGCIAWASMNCPGSWHDSACSSGLFEKLRTQTPDPFFIVGDSAFPNKGTIALFLQFYLIQYFTIVIYRKFGNENKNSFEG